MLAARGRAERKAGKRKAGSVHRRARTLAAAAAVQSSEPFVLVCLLLDLISISVQYFVFSFSFLLFPSFFPLFFLFIVLLSFLFLGGGANGESINFPQNHGACTASRGTKYEVAQTDSWEAGAQQ